MKQRMVTVSLGLLLAMPVLADTPAANTLDATQVIAPLFFVVILIFLLAWLVKKLNPRLPRTAGHGITVLSSISIAHNVRLCLIRVGHHDMLLGVTNQQITHLQTFAEPVVVEQPPTENAKNARNTAQRFRDLLQRNTT